MSEMNQTCPACTAELRPNAIFCHRCGVPLTAEAEQIAGDLHTQNLSPLEIAEIGEKIHAANTGEIKSPEINIETKKSGALNAVETAPETTETVIVAADNNGFKPTETEKSADKPAAAPMPVKRRVRQYAKQTEYVWEESAVPIWNIVASAVVALIFVLVLLWMNNFLRF